MIFNQLPDLALRWKILCHALVNSVKAGANTYNGNYFCLSCSGFCFRFCMISLHYSVWLIIKWLEIEKVNAHSNYWIFVNAISLEISFYKLNTSWYNIRYNLWRQHVKVMYWTDEENRDEPFKLIIRHNTRQIELGLQQYLCFEEVSQRSAQVPTGPARTFAIRGTNIRVALLCYL